MQHQPRTLTLALSALMASGVFLAGCDDIVSAEAGVARDAGRTEQVAGGPEAGPEAVGVIDASAPARPAAKAIAPGDVENDTLRIDARFLSRY